MAKYAAYRDELAYQYELDGAMESTVPTASSSACSAWSSARRILLSSTTDTNASRGSTGFSLDMCREFTIDSKLIVWTGFVANVDWLADSLAEFDTVRMHGNLPIHERNRAIESFTRSTSKILVATPGAAKEGLTLTTANHAIFYDRSFSLDDYLQAQDRIHRISQTRDCYIHNLIARDTIDEWVDVLLAAKYRAAQLRTGRHRHGRVLQTLSAATCRKFSELSSSQTARHPRPAPRDRPKAQPDEVRRDDHRDHGEARPRSPTSE